jgi:hypothetical protein
VRECSVCCYCLRWSRENRLCECMWAVLATAKRVRSKEQGREKPVRNY